MYSLNIGLQGWDLAAEEGQGPEIFGDVNGEPTGDALVIFETVLFLHTLSLTHTHSLSRTHSLSYTHSLSLSHTHTLSLTLTHTHTNTPKTFGDVHGFRHL